jgi:hypothetical protein
MGFTTSPPTPVSHKMGTRLARTTQTVISLRHSLRNWLVNKAKVDPKTVQGILRHSKIQTTLDLYTQEDSDETRAAQCEFLSAVGMTGDGAVDVGWLVGWNSCDFENQSLLTALE